MVMRTLLPCINKDEGDKIIQHTCLKMTTKKTCYRSCGGDHDGGGDGDGDDSGDGDDDDNDDYDDGQKGD